MPGTRAFYQRIEHGEPGVADPELLRSLERWLGPWARLWFRPSLEGEQHLPPSGPFLLVANHSGGGVAEVICFILLWWKRFGTTRPIAGFAHPLAFRMPGLAQANRRLGVIPSTYAAADRALGAGVPVLIFPGGDHEGFRPVWKARTVDFGGRHGFLKIVRKHGIPLVPLVIAGSHVTNPILWRSRLLAWILIWPRLAGVKRVPLTALALAVCVAACVAGYVLLGPLASALAAWASFTLVPASFVPWVPSRVRLIVLPAISPEEIGDDLDAAYARVVELMQRQLRDRSR